MKGNLISLISLIFILLTWRVADDGPLHDAARDGDIAKARELLAQGADVNAKTNYGATPLAFAAVNGNLDIAKLLIEKGADVNAKQPETLHSLTRQAIH